MESVREALLDVARNHPGTLELPEPMVFFESFGDSALNLELVVWSAEMSYRPRRFRSDLNFAIDRAFRERGVEVPFPQRDIHHRTGNPISEAKNRKIIPAPLDGRQLIGRIPSD